MAALRAVGASQGNARVEKIDVLSALGRQRVPDFLHSREDQILNQTVD